MGTIDIASIQPLDQKSGYTDIGILNQQYLLLTLQTLMSFLILKPRGLLNLTQPKEINQDPVFCFKGHKKWIALLRNGAWATRVVGENFKLFYRKEGDQVSSCGFLNFFIVNKETNFRGICYLKIH